MTLALAALPAPACRGRDAAAPERARPRIALVLKTLNSPFFIDMQRGAEEAARRLGVDLVVQAPERELDVEKQMQIVETLIETRVSALLLVPCGSRELVPAVGKANRARIPVLILDDALDPAAAAEAGVRSETYIGSDNVEGGRVAGRHLVSRSGGRARVAVLEGIPGHETGDSRLSGFKEALAEAAGVHIVASQTANWERDQGFSVAQNLLQAHPELDWFFACNDVMALGAVEAIAAAGRAGRVRVIGFDAVDDARRAVEAGAMEASVAQYPAEMGRLAVESAVKILGGGTVPVDQRTRIGLVTRDAVGTGTPAATAALRSR